MADREKWSKAYTARLAANATLLRSLTAAWLGQPIAECPTRERELQTYLQDALKIPREEGAKLWPVKGSRQKWDLLAHSPASSSRRAILMVEAKAHHGELEWDGKRTTSTSPGSRYNHAAIVARLHDVQVGLSRAAMTQQV